MSLQINMTYELFKADALGFRLRKALSTIQTEDEHQDFEALIRIKDEFRNDGLQWALEIVAEDLSRLQNITIHPTLIMQLTLILAGAQLVFHRDRPRTRQDYKFHIVGFHFYMLMNSFANLRKDEPDNMKSTSQFTGQLLKGLWYKHVDDASKSGMATNILNEIRKKDWLMKALADHFGPSDSSKVFGDEHTNFLAHQLIVASLRNRAARKEMTGEWIVYKKNDDKIHLLTLASHQEDDNRILRRIKP